ncbi:MAG: exodeoxyribonuclease III [Polyangiales bacterium]
MSTHSTFRLVSWNVNGIRACARKGLAAWLQAEPAEAIALQEVRALPAQVPPALQQPEGMHTDFHPAERPGYSGVALYCRTRPDRIWHDVGVEAFDREGRLQFAEFGALLLVNAYFPNGNGKARDNSRVPFKLDFYAHLFDQLEGERAAGRPILVAGDFNTAHEAIDLARPKANEKTSGFLPEERAEFSRWLAAGWVDTFRHFETGAGHYSWWSQRAGARSRNVGWRIDYVLASHGAMPWLQEARIHPEVLGSDHCPVSVTLDSAVTSLHHR